MIETRVRFSTTPVTSTTVRRLGLDFTRGEPSHIHLPRRHRATRPVDQDDGATTTADIVDVGQRELANAATDEE